MNIQLNISNIIAWLFGLLILTIGFLNLFLVHPVPGIIYILLSLLFLPPSYSFFTKMAGFSIPLFVKIILGIVIMWFTLGVSDLADMYHI